ncbi:hypothetical protein P691DRAFT_769472 [Macrolepiota fuliginosa MF-IS2]|uniref:Uncharacterized protein n=1 Tax=Macrolepiota fuliginosa MF-IS2 TaxID=1400762 RepID=A0A9P5WWL8_9AGAR|nr:hypothetical protein P691DRAFT_769472 [Macrolepiota fuliginosa MF-IS2]
MLSVYVVINDRKRCQEVIRRPETFSIQLTNVQLPTSETSETSDRAMTGQVWRSIGPEDDNQKHF